jgi:hypothetical protein
MNSSATRKPHKRVRAVPATAAGKVHVWRFRFKSLTRAADTGRSSSGRSFTPAERRMR